jgi:hypothetical protein
MASANYAILDKRERATQCSRIWLDARVSDTRLPRVAQNPPQKYASDSKFLSLRK